MKILRLQMTPLGLSEVTLQVVLSLMIVILTTLEMPVMLLENIYSTGITHDDHPLRFSYFLSYRPLGLSFTLGPKP